jgi:prepilin-type N-terminal cleavage/methylation domain-containing protein
MRYKNKGFTIIEILTVLAVMAILIGVLLPALTTARNAARTAKQRVQFVSIDQALLAWRNDFGEYPQSSLTQIKGGTQLYCGAQKLAEAMLGLDLMGFYPKSLFDAYLPDYPGYQSNPTGRKPRYLELETANAFFLGEQHSLGLDGLFKTTETLFTNTNLVPYGYVLCDVFLNRTVNIGGKSVKAGMPILYYRANPSGDGLHKVSLNKATYNYFDNQLLADLVNNSNNSNLKLDLINKITDPKVIHPVEAYPWPYKPDSYILISAGIDGLYGTADDITNFGY